MRTVLAAFLLVAALPALAQQSRHFLVQNPSADPIAGATVTVSTEDGTAVGSQDTDADGAAEVDGIEPSVNHSVRVSAVNYVARTLPLAGGQNAQNPMVITLSRTTLLPPPPPRGDTEPDPPPPAMANATIALTDGFFNETLAAGWQHTAPGSGWMQRCQLFQGGTDVMPTGWVMRSSTRIFNLWGSASCHFTLFAGRELNEPWTLVGFTMVDGRTTDECQSGAVVNETSAPAGGPSTIPLSMHILTPNGECSVAVTAVVVNGPTGDDPREAFLP